MCPEGGHSKYKHLRTYNELEIRTPFPPPTPNERSPDKRASPAEIGAVVILSVSVAFASVASAVEMCAGNQRREPVNDGSKP